MIGPQRLGRCLNAGRCGLAGERGPIPIAADAPFTCPECRSELIPHEGRAKKVEPGKKLPKVPKMLLLPALLLALLVIIGIRYDLFGGFDIEDTPPLASEGPTLLTAPGSVRTGTSLTTYDELAPGLWRAFLVDQGCPEVKRQVDKGKTILQCATGTNPKVAISAPESAMNRAGTVMKTFDVLLTTDPAYADAPSNDRPVIVTGDGLVVHGDVVGIDALAIIVNPANPLTRLSQPQLASIFLGQTTDYAEVGGKAGPIHVIAPAAGPAATDRLNAIVPQWLPLTPRARRLSNSDDIVAAVLADPAAIGLVERRAATAARSLAIGPQAGAAVPPTPVALISGDYPLARPVRAVRFNRDDSPYETGFVDFARSERARASITAAGFEPVRPDFFQAGPPPEAPAAYKALVRGGSRIAANLRFRAGSLDLESWSRADLDAIAARLAGERVSPGRIRIIGLSDPARPDAAADADALARQIATLLASRGIDSASATGFGGAMPIAEPAQGNRNRRVEIWLSPGGGATTAPSP
jgi:phosphate transport system substrate-binding protein